MSHTFNSQWLKSAIEVILEGLTLKYLAHTRFGDRILEENNPVTFDYIDYNQDGKSFQIPIFITLIQNRIVFGIGEESSTETAKEDLNGMYQ